MKSAIKSTIAIAATTAAIAGVAALPSLVSAWGDNFGYNPETGKNGRSSYTVDQINNGALGKVCNKAAADYESCKNDPNYPGKIVFNSISDSMPVGDGVNGGSEKNFVGARECVLRDDGRCESVDKTGKGWLHNDITVEDGKTYIIRMYVHNNNPNGTDAVAEDTHVSFSLPGTTGKQVQVNGFINSSNAVPTEYWDYVNFNSEVPFHLEYVFGSALLENNSIGLGGLTLSDDVVKAKSGGTLIGYDALDGRIPGCYQYDNFVTIQVKAVFDYEYTVDKKVRLADSEDRTWKESVDAKIGDKVEFRILYTNTSDKKQDNVAIKDILPSNLKYVKGSTILKNTSYPNGAYILNDSLVENGIRIGNYAANGGNALLYFTAEVVDENLACGDNTLINWAQAGVGQKTIQDNASVKLNKYCKDTPTPTPTPEPTPETPSELPTTGPEAIIGGVAAAGSIVTAAGYYIASRRQLR